MCESLADLERGLGECLAYVLLSCLLVSQTLWCEDPIVAGLKAGGWFWPLTLLLLEK